MTCENERVLYRSVKTTIKPVRKIRDLLGVAENNIYISLFYDYTWDYAAVLYLLNFEYLLKISESFSSVTSKNQRSCH